jgi:hypothetical protein
MPTKKSEISGAMDGTCDDKFGLKNVV